MGLLERLYFLMLVSSLAFVGCGPQMDVAGQGLESLSSSNPARQTACKVAVNGNTQSLSALSVAHAKPKIFSKSKFGIESKARSRLSGTALALTVKKECLQDSNFLKKHFSREELDLIQKREISEVQTLALSLKSNESFEDFSAEVQGDSCVLGVSHNREIRLSMTPTDPLFSSQRFHTLIRAPQAWDVFYGSRGIQAESIVAVIDSGVDFTHEELQGQSWVNTAEIPGNGVDDDGNGYVDDVNGYNFADRSGNVGHTGTWAGYNHGSHVAGIIAAKDGNARGGVGVSSRRTKLMSLNIFGATSASSTEKLDEAIRYAARMGANVINLSLGGVGRSDTTAAAIDEALALGITVITASGNSSMDIDGTFFTPASYAKDRSGLIAVSATTDQKGLANFSNYGVESVEIGTPGVSIVSTLDQNRYGSMSGTSMSAPQMSAAAGLVSSYFYTYVGRRPTAGEVEGWILQSADSISQLTSYIQSGRFLNLQNLTTLLQSLVLAPPTPPSC